MKRERESEAARIKLDEREQLKLDSELAVSLSYLGTHHLEKQGTAKIVWDRGVTAAAARRTDGRTIWHCRLDLVLVARRCPVCLSASL